MAKKINIEATSELPNQNQWRNRIIGYSQEDPESLLANPDNFRVHGKDQQTSMRGVLDEVGWVEEVIVNQNTGHMIDGHMRVMLAMKHKEPTVPVKWVDLTEAEEKLVLATLNPLGAMASTDRASLDGLIRDISTGNKDIQNLLAQIAANAGLYMTDIPEADRNTTFGSNPHEENYIDEWQLEVGQLWAIPSKSVLKKSHKLLIIQDYKDINQDNINKLVGSNDDLLIDASMITDIPYDRRRQGYETLSTKELKECWQYIINTIPITNGIVAAFHSPLFINHWINLLENTSDITFERLCWIDKTNPDPLTFRGFSMAGEVLCLHSKGQNSNSWQEIKPFAKDCSKGNKSFTPAWGKNYTSLKPHEFIIDLIKRCTIPASVIYDPFLNSGEIMIAAEEASRVCYGFESNLDYISVILHRMSEAGLRPQLLD